MKFIWWTLTYWGLFLVFRIYMASISPGYRAQISEFPSGVNILADLTSWGIFFWIWFGIVRDTP